MKTTLNNNIQKAYIKNIKKQLKISSKYKRTLLNDLEINIDSYISEHPNTTYKNLVENFGTKEDMFDLSINKYCVEGSEQYEYFKVESKVLKAKPIYLKFKLDLQLYILFWKNLQ